MNIRKCWGNIERHLSRLFWVGSICVPYQLALMYNILGNIFVEQNYFLSGRKRSGILAQYVWLINAHPVCCVCWDYWCVLVLRCVQVGCALHTGLVPVMALYFCRFCDDVELMLGTRPALFWRVCWQYISPIFLAVSFPRVNVTITLFFFRSFWFYIEWY